MGEMMAIHCSSTAGDHEAQWEKKTESDLANQTALWLIAEQGVRNPDFTIRHQNELVVLLFSVHWQATTVSNLKVLRESLKAGILKKGVFTNSRASKSSWIY